MDFFRRIFNHATNDEQPAKPENQATSDNVISSDNQHTAVIEQPVVDTAPLIPNGRDTQELAVLQEDNEPTNDSTTRELPLEAIISTKNERLIFGQSTDVGMVRNNNQDAVLSTLHTSRSSEQPSDFGLFIVADGMGGHHDGEKASALAARTVAAYVTRHILQPVILDKSDEQDSQPVTEVLVQAVQQANEEVIAAVPEGGTTLTSVVVMGNLAYIAHVGDSRVYLITADGLEQITRDHSLVQRLVELDQLTEKEALDHPQKNVLYRALGQNETLEVDSITRRLPPSSRLLVCSDGLWNLVDNREIGEIAMSHHDPQVVCDKLVALANARGGTDNITAILLQVPGN